MGEGSDPGINPSGSERLWGHGRGSPLPSPFPFSSRENKISATAAGVPGTGQLWGSGCFFLMELGTIPGTLAKGDALTGIRPEERHPPLQKHAGLDCTRLDLHSNPFPGTRETFSALPSLPTLVRASCSFSWSFWTLLLPKSLGSCPCQGAWLFGGPWFPCSGAGRCFLLHSPGYWAQNASKQIGFSTPCERELEEGLGGFSIVPARWRQLGLFGV